MSGLIKTLIQIYSRREPSQIRTVATSAKCVLGENPGYGYLPFSVKKIDIQVFIKKSKYNLFGFLCKCMENIFQAVAF